MFANSLLRSGLKIAGVGGALSATLAYRSDSRMLSECKSRSSPLTEMNDKVVLVTGASAGIGSSIAWRFAEAGSKVRADGRDGGRSELHGWIYANEMGMHSCRRVWLA